MVRSPTNLYFGKYLKPFMLTASKRSFTVLMKSCRQKQSYREIFGEMLIRTIPKTVLQIFCKIIQNYHRSRRQFLEELVLGING